MLSNKIKLLYTILDYWEECTDDHSLMNPSHHIAVSDTINCSFCSVMIKNSFKTITRQFLIQVKRKYGEIQKSKNINLWFRMDYNNLIDAGFILNLMDELKIDKITLYDSKEPQKAFAFMFIYKNIVYYGGIASRVIDAEEKDEFKNFLNIKFTRKKSLRNI